ncbi:MAG: hypothetical protein FWB85_07120 [Chitinispirillia bacterium]|nr:hypothetical protein [Chitinispirillia bacterium]MCL2241993.1 hypothetical protein [Chitinispirillia bacterium]
MKTIDTETQLYSQLARRGDPSAFYALFHEHIRNLYVLLRSQGKDHAAACESASTTLETMYRRFIRRSPDARPQKWFAAGCRLRRFDPGAAGISVSLAEAGAYERAVHTTLLRAYSERLDRGNDGKGNLRSERPYFPYIVTVTIVAALAGFLFFSEAVLSISLGRFDKEYKASFPKMADGLWSISGLVRDGSNVNEYFNKEASALPGQTGPADANE